MTGLRIFALACLLLPGLAHAQTPTDDEEAHLRFEAGRAAYARGRYEDALEDFQRAYELSQRYELFYNLGQVYDHLRQDDDAIEAFTHFLERAPETDSNREEVTRRIQVIRDAQARRAAEQHVDEAPPPAPPPAASADPTGWILVGVGGAVLIAGAAMTAIGFGDQASVEGATAPTTWAQIHDAYDQAPILEGVGIGALVVGAAVATVGLVLALTSSSSSPEHASLRLGPGRISLEGSF